MNVNLTAPHTPNAQSYKEETMMLATTSLLLTSSHSH